MFNKLNSKLICNLIIYSVIYRRLANNANKKKNLEKDFEIIIEKIRANVGNISPASYTVIELFFHTNSFLSMLKVRETKRKSNEMEIHE